MPKWRRAAQMRERVQKVRRVHVRAVLALRRFRTFSSAEPQVDLSGSGISCIVMFLVSIVCLA